MPCLMYLHIFSAAITNTKRNSLLIGAVTVHLVPRIVYMYMFLLFHDLFYDLFYANEKSHLSQKKLVLHPALRGR